MDSKSSGTSNAISSADKQGADRFIAEQIAVYGLNGTNTLKNPDAGFPRAPVPNESTGIQLDFSFGRHFKFGYNGEVGRFRESSTCMYWTEHGRPRRAIGTILDELSLAAKEAVENYRELALVYTGSVYCQLVLKAFARSKEKLTLVVPRLADGPEIPIEGPSEIENELRSLGFALKAATFTWNEFEAFLDRSAAEVRGTDPNILFSVFIANGRQELFIFENHLPRVVDLNFDLVQGKSVGPVNWCLEELESDMDAARSLEVLGRSGVVDFFRSTPEILPAYVNYALSGGQVSSLTSAGMPEPFREKFFGIQERLIAKSPKAREAWHTSLARLAKQWQICDDRFHRMNEEHYGLVY